jgi:hypothetical protein
MREVISINGTCMATRSTPLFHLNIPHGLP